MQRTTGKKSGCEMVVVFLFALCFCDVLVLHCLVEIVTLNTVHHVSLQFFSTVHSVHLESVVCNCGSEYTVYISVVLPVLYNNFY